MLRRIVAEVVAQLVGVPREPVPPLLRQVGEAQARRAAGERRRHPPEPEAAARDEGRRARPEPAPTADLGAGPGILDELGSPAEARRAFVLMEILGPPVSLRDRRGDPDRK
jgi:hypothetical protein